MSDHDWCRDVRRDEQVRAAEDAAAVPAIQHRDLPEQVALLWASLNDIIGRVVRLEGEMDAGQDDSASPAEGLRTERVPLEVTHCATKSIRDLAGRDVRGWLETFGESVRVVDEADAASDEAVANGATLSALAGARESLAAANRGIARLTAERDAAIRERDEALSAAGITHGVFPELYELRAERERLRGRVAELEAAAPPRGWLTAEERALIEYLRATFEQNADALRPHGLGGHVDNQERRVRLLDAILARSTPPRVKGPTGWAYDAHDMAWIAAIRAAGGEVEG